MKPTILLLLSCAVAFSQPFGFGIRGGVPMTDFLNATSRPAGLSYIANTNRYVVGPTAELRLPFGFGIEVDALYRHYGYNAFGALTSATTTGAWEFPLLAKYKFKAPLIHPFLDAGIAWDKLSGLTQAVSNAVHTSNPLELHKDVTHGFVFGGGVEVKAILIRIAPEVRFTRWNDQHFLDPTGILKSNLNQAEFLVGITF